MNSELETWDVVALVVYFGIILLIGILSSLRANRGSVTGYFLADKRMSWFTIGASLFASNIGSEHFVGLAGSGAASGIAVGALEIMAIATLQVLGWVMLPVYISSKVSTLPEYMTKRFGKQRIRMFLAVLSLMLYILAKVSVSLFCGAIFIQQFIGLSTYSGVFVLLLVTVICTIFGGLKSVIYIETFQTALMLVGAGGVAGYALFQVGGYSGLQEKYMQTYPLPVVSLNRSFWNNDTGTSGFDYCYQPNKDAFRMMRGPNDRDLPALGLLFGGAPSGIWYWAADQMMVQRAMAAKDISSAQGGTIFAGYIKVLPFFIIVLPGMVSRVLFPDEVVCNSPEKCMASCGNPNSCFNSAYPKLMKHLLPQGVRGIILAAILAALMSSFMSIFNSAAILASVDIWGVIRKNASEREKLIVGRLWVLVMVVLSIVWIPVLEQADGGQIIIYVVSVGNHLATPLAAVYLLAILWKRCNEKGAFWSLIVGTLIGAVRLNLVLLYYGEPQCGQQDTRPLLFRIHYFYFAFALFWTTVFVAVAISLLTKPLENYRVIRTTYWTRYDKFTRPDEYEVETVSDVSSSSEIEMEKFIDSATPKSRCCSDKKNNVKRTGLNSGKTNPFLGLMNSVCFGSKQAKDHAEQKRLEAYASLEQTWFQKTILNVNLVIVLCVNLALVVFFSL